MLSTDRFFEVMCLAVRQAGATALRLQGQVKNIGKPVVKTDLDEPERLTQARAAKTVVDEVIQEILLLAAAEVLDPKLTLLDAEEDTPTESIFSTDESMDTSLIIDPIDGTIEYLEGNDSYTVCVGLVHQGKVISSLVFFPARDQFYCIAPDGRAYHKKGFMVEGFSDPFKLKLADHAQPVIYRNRRVTEEKIKNLEAAGFTVITDIEANVAPADATLKVLTGEATAYLAANHQIRDILVMPIIGSAEAGKLSNFNNQPLLWRNHGRMPEVVVLHQSFQLP